MSASKEERVRVAVRVRPFSQKEVARGCKRVVDMDGGVTTILTNPTDPADRKNFSFDHSYWSFDGFIHDDKGKNVSDPSHPRGNQYCDQKRLFEDLGRTMLTDAFEGYNTTLFSYGQTGSGKSYSVIGYGPNEGIVPQFCHQIFQTLDQYDMSDPAQFEVHLSMLEIYNETVHDLLVSSKNEKGLKVREHPKKGFYADGLSSFLVTNYPEIERLIGQGTLNRTVVATNMNATSSRSHAIVTISLVQKRTRQDGQVITSAVVNIVDLAGSERVSKVGNSSGERFREGVAINQSLQCLGHCIRALAETSMSTSTHSNKTQRIPYRDSVLTKLLMNALGGNSKTIMIASVSPADIHYEETLSTLRYADRAKHIRTRATVNEDPTEKIVRDLKVENQRLKAVLTRGNIDPQWLKAVLHSRPTNPQTLKEARKKWEDELRAQMAENEREMKQIRLSSRQEKMQIDLLDTPEVPTESQQTHQHVGPYLQNVNMDPLLNGRWLHYLNQGVTLIGKGHSRLSNIEMIGPGIQAEHAEISVDGDKVTLRPLTENGRVLINGLPIDPHLETTLQPNDRLVFGATQLWLFRHPALEVEAGVSNSPMINYDFVLHEMAAKSGLDMMSSDGKDSLQEELVSILPSVEEANEISAEMDKRVKFEIVLVAPQSIGNQLEKVGPSQIYIKMKNFEQGTEYLWSKDKFYTRFDFMRELYRQYQLRNINEEDEEAIDFTIADDRDPFLESPDAVVIIGVARLFLQSLAYLEEIHEHVPITDLRGIQVGSMEIALIPVADAQGNQLREQNSIVSADQLIGRNLYFDFHILGCRNLPPKFKDLHCKYRFYGDKQDSRTEMLSYSSNLQFNHGRMLRFEPVTREFLEYLNHGSVVVEVLGRHLIDSHNFHQPSSLSYNSQQFSRVDPRMLSRSGQVLDKMSAMNNGTFGPKSVDGKKQELLAELQLVKQTHVRLQQRLDFIRQMIDRCLLVGQESIPTALLDAMLNVNSPEQARHIVQQLQVDDGSEWADWTVTNQQKEQRSSVCSIS